MSQLKAGYSYGFLQMSSWLLDKWGQVRYSLGKGMVAQWRGPSSSSVWPCHVHEPASSVVVSLAPVMGLCTSGAPCWSHSRPAARTEIAQPPCSLILMVVPTVLSPLSSAISWPLPCHLVCLSISAGTEHRI